MPLPLIVLIAVFCLGYAAIVFEHRLGVDKAACALLTGVLCWVVWTLGAPLVIDPAHVPPEIAAAHPGHQGAALVRGWIGEHRLQEALGEIAGILFFLLGAMTIVELVDSWGGFRLVTDRIRARSSVALLWIVGLVAFVLSAVLDNLTTTIVMISLLRKLVRERHDRHFLAGIVVIAANAGGAWSPIGDVTTTMLWIGGRISTLGIIQSMLLPSLACLLVPLAWLSLRLRGQRIEPPELAPPRPEATPIPPAHRRLMFALGVGGLLFVPVFKTLTQLPPWMGMLFSLGVLWVVSEFLHPGRDSAADSETHVLSVLKRIDTPSILFFLGILSAVAALQDSGLLRDAALALGRELGSIDLIVFLIGLLSAVVDNVPLVAAVMGMYDLATYPVDSLTWSYLAFAAGTGGSCLIIGSAAGVAAMGLERIQFFWYLRNIGSLALLGYLSGTAVVFLPRLL